MAAYRRLQSTEALDPDDQHPYAVEGTNNIKDLVESFERGAGILNKTTDWPSTEGAMLHLQKQDPVLKRVIAEWDSFT